MAITMARRSIHSLSGLDGDRHPVTENVVE
jgi:hypothetical protein